MYFINYNEWGYNIMSVWDWQTAPGTFRVQNKNYLGEAIDNFYQRWYDYNNIIPPDKLQNLTDKQAGATKFYTVDSSVRIPIKFQYDFSHSFARDLVCKAASGKYIAPGGHSTSNPRDRNVQWVMHGGGNRWGKSQEILDFIPRLYISKLIPLSEFLDTIDSSYKYFWISKFIFSNYNAPPYGFSYVPINKEDLIAPLKNFYVLAEYEVWTNNPGKEQTKISYMTVNDPYKGNSNYAFVDTFIPITLHVDHNVQNYKYNMLIPYMKSFSASFREEEAGNFEKGIASYIGEPSGQGSGDGVLLSGINKIRATAVDTITENPYIYGPVVGTSHYDNDRRLSPTDYSLPNYDFTVATKDVWEKIFDGSGMLWSYDRDTIISPNDTDLHKPITPGQPDNPTGGGQGDGDNLSDDIPLPTVSFFPNNSAYKRYWLTPPQLVDVQNWIFNKTFFDNILRLWNDPAEYLINISFYPFNGHLHDINHVTQSLLSIGNLTSEIQCYAMGDEYNPVFMGGDYPVKEYYGSYMDYAPYTTAEIYIPYIGYRVLNINDIMGKTLSLRYVVDWDTNIITATILSDNQPLTMYSGSFGVKLSLSGTNANQLAETITRGAISTFVSTAGVVGSIAGTVAAGATGNIPGAIQGAAQTSQSIGGLVGGVTDTVMNTQVHPRYYGQPTPSTGLYNPQVPHIIFHRPITAEPLDYRSLHGYAAGYSGKVSEFSGYLQCKEIQLGANTTISAAEQTEIINLMKGGIFT